MNNIYLIERTDNVGYDEFDKLMVVDETLKKAIASIQERYYGFVDGNIVCELIGQAKKNQAKGVVLASFCAG